MNIQKIITHQNTAKLTAALGVGAVAVTKTLQNVSEEKTFDYMENTPSALYGRSQISYQREDPIFKEGESVAEFLERMKKGMEIEVQTRYTDPQEPEIDWNDIDYSEFAKYSTEAELNEVLNKINNPKLKDIIKLCYENNILYKNTVDFVSEMEIKSNNIKDPVILNFLEKTYDEILKVKIEKEAYDFDFFPADISNKLEAADKVIDSYNTIKGNYSQIKSLNSFNGDLATDYKKSVTKEYLETELKKMEEDPDPDDISLKERMEAYYRTNGKFFDQDTEDFIWRQKSEVFETLVKQDEIKNYLYDLYLKELTIPSQAKNICKEILEKYNVMLLPSMHSMDFKKEFEYIKNELEAWKVASNGEANFPEVINLNSINSRYLNNTAGSNDAFNKIISIKTGYMKNIAYALRHELMHENDKLKYRLMNIGEERVKLLNEIMPIKKVNGKKIRDYANCKYREEFLKIGVIPKHIDYAYTNRKEFLAVAAEGDLSKCSEEFKEVLIKLGMPEYVFELKILNPKTKENCEKIEKILEKYPDAKDYPTMIKYLKRDERMERMETIQTFRILLEMFKDEDEQK